MSSRVKFLSIIKYTFRESFAKKTFITFFGLSTILHLFFIFALNIDIIDGAMAMINVMGQEVEKTDIRKILITVQSAIAGVAFAGGIFLSIFATANFIPSMLEKGHIELLISKPLARYQILLGKYLGAQANIAFNVVYLILGSWLIMSLKTGIWYFQYLYTIPMVIATFAIVYALMVLVGVLSRSPGVTIMVAFSVFFLSQFLMTKDQIYAFLNSKFYYYLLEGFYHVLPKISELGEMNITLVLGKPIESWMPLWTSAISGAVMLSVATYIFAKKDF